MGYGLYGEVKRWAPDGLTKGEKLAALIIADDANDKTRLTYNSVVDPEIMRQALVPDERAMRRIVAALQKQKVLEHAGGGHNGRTAKYRFLPLAPTAGARPELKGENHPPTDGPADGVAGPKSPAYAEDDEAAPAENHPPTHGVAGRFSARSRVKTTRPTSSTSSTTTSTSAGEPAAAKPRAPKQAVKGRTGDGRHQVADDLTEAFWKLHGKGRAQSFIAIRGVIRTAIGNGVERDQLARALDRVAGEGRSISGATLDIALGQLNGTSSKASRGGARNPISSHDDIKNGNVTIRV